MRINRDKYLHELISKMHNKTIKVITGIRRCGISYLLNETFIDSLIFLGVSSILQAIWYFQRTLRV